MRFIFTAKNTSLLAGAIAATLLVGAPLQSNASTAIDLADNHTDGSTMMDSPEGSSDGMANQSMNIVELASSSESFNTLVQAVQAAELAGTLSGEGPYTVFAPTDEAFNQLPDGALEFLLQPENQDLLAQVLSYHVVQGSVMSSDISPGVVETLNGGLAVGVDGSRVIINNASVVNANLQASNGVVHAVNRVLIPEPLQQQLASRLGIDDIY